MALGLTRTFARRRSLGHEESGHAGCVIQVHDTVAPHGWDDYQISRPLQALEWPAEDRNATVVEISRQNMPEPRMESMVHFSDGGSGHRFGEVLGGEVRHWLPGQTYLGQSYAGSLA